jgi:hypothetical protein
VHLVRNVRRFQLGKRALLSMSVRNLAGSSPDCSVRPSSSLPPFMRGSVKEIVCAYA